MYVYKKTIDVTVHYIVCICNYCMNVSAWYNILLTTCIFTTYVV